MTVERDARRCLRLIFLPGGLEGYVIRMFDRQGFPTDEPAHAAIVVAEFPCDKTVRFIDMEPQRCGVLSTRLH